MVGGKYIKGLPWGPREDLVILARVLHASIFLRIASSSPEKCFDPYNNDKI
jgi:hypothetical protein